MLAAPAPAAQRTELPVLDGYQSLDKALRDVLNAVNRGEYVGLSVRKVSADLSISRTYLRRYKDGEQDVCLRIMNRLANYFDIKYNISNFEDLTGSIG